MTVSLGTSYAERAWSGVETSFDPGMQALDGSHVSIRYLNGAGAISALTRNVHFSATIGAGGAVSIAPIALPPAPGTLLITRRTPSTVSVQFNDLEDFPASEHQLLADAAALRDQELWDYVGRFVVPFTNLGGVLDFSPYRLRAADPLADADLATRGYVLQITGVLSLQTYVNQAAASAAAAVVSASGAATSKTGADSARDHGAACGRAAAFTCWSPATDFSAKSYAADAAASAATATGYANLLNAGDPRLGRFPGCHVRDRQLGRLFSHEELTK
jgi:hypothetical protein